VSLNVDQAVGAALRELRRRKGLTQEGLALEAGAERAYVSLIERGKNSPSARMLFRLCEILDTTPSVLLAEAERLLAEQA
jgi:transcriptional regulator with XRE-family HTH domain